MATRYTSFEPRGNHPPDEADAFELARDRHASASDERTPPLMGEEQPLSAEDCAIGEVIAGKYLVEGVIGRGSMGVVVRATHLGFDELVALKFIRPEMRAIDGIVSRFAREAKASVRIRNEHAVNVLDVGVAEPIGPFFAMEFLEGINLEELVDSQGAFDRAIAVKYVLEACEGLAAAHAQGIIHRDIKPQNLFLAWQGRLELIKILDFGISKAALSGQVFGDDLSIGEQDWVMGTPLYMSPEQLRHTHDIDERTDIWSLGAVLYELLVGQPLFSGGTETAVCRQVFEVGERSIRVDVPGVPDALWDIVECCLSLDRERRYSNVAELGQALLPFAPPAAVLHVERARALLGLERLDFLGFDEEIEDIDAEPIEDDEPAEPAAVTAVATAKSHGARRATWVEVALPLLACAVAWVGYRQWQQGRESAEVRTHDAIQTVALALQQSGLPSKAAAGAQQRRADCPVAAPAASEADATAPSQDAPAGARVPSPGSVTAAAPSPASSVAPGADDGTQGSPPPLVAQHASGARRSSGAPASTPAAASTTPRRPSGTAAPASTAEPRSDVASEAGRRVSAQQHQRSKPRLEPKPQFRLIDEHPHADMQLVPGQTSSVVPASR